MELVMYIFILLITFSFGWLMRLLFEEQKNKKTGVDMNINEFVTLVTKIEGKKKQVDIAQIKEIFKIVDDLLGGEFYKLIKSSKVKKTNG